MCWSTTVSAATARAASSVRYRVGFTSAPTNGAQPPGYTRVSATFLKTRRTALFENPSPGSPILGRNKLALQRHGREALPSRGKVKKMSAREAAPRAPSHRRVLVASLVGTAVEFYDFYIYATAASLVLGPLFFPAASPSAQLLSSYATFAVAFFARPLGAAFFGHFGDRIGRKSTL